MEDAALLRDLARRVLERQGHTVVPAADAEEALRLFESDGAIDVLLTDIVLPGRSGPELAADIVARRPGIKVLFMSGYSEETVLKHGILEPGVAFLHKPFTFDTLGRKIQEPLA